MTGLRRVLPGRDPQVGPDGMGGIFDDGLTRCGCLGMGRALQSWAEQVDHQRGDENDEDRPRPR